MNWIIIGIAGVTNGGKTTLANALVDYFSANDDLKRLNELKVNVKDVKLMHQDAYIRSKGRVNRETLEVIEMDRMMVDLESLIGSDTFKSPKPLKEINGDVKILIVEGYLIFNYEPLLNLCHLKFNVNLSYELCRERRESRIYPFKSPPNYFDEFIWPLYQIHLAEYADRKDIMFLEGDTNKTELFNQVLEHIFSNLK